MSTDPQTCGIGRDLVSHTDLHSEVEFSTLEPSNLEVSTLEDIEVRNEEFSTLLHKKLVHKTRELRELSYNAIFEVILDRISEGISLKESIRSDARDIDYADFIRWIHRNLDRKLRYYEAQEIGSETIASEIIDIADGNNSLEDVQRSRLRIEARQFLMKTWNRKRFGEVKQLEFGGTISITNALQQADMRLVGSSVEDSE